MSRLALKLYTVKLKKKRRRRREEGGLEKQYSINSPEPF
jgi:hypothetical protein